MARVLFVFLFSFSSLSFAGNLVSRDFNGQQFGTGLFVMGDIDQKLTDSFIRFTRSYDPFFDTYLVLDNPGGLVNEVQLLSSVIQTLAMKIYLKTKKPLNVLVLNSCHSACIAVFSLISSIKASPEFQNVVDIRINENATFGFHAASRGGVVSIEGTARYIDLLKKGGVSNEWLNQNRKLFETTRLTEVSAKDLFKQGFLSQMSDMLF